jgi:hypothetical protein
VRALYRPDLVFEKTGVTSIAGFFPIKMDVANELPKLREIVKSNLGRALLPETHTMLVMRFVANDGEENLLWSLSFDTEKVRAKYGELVHVLSDPAALVRELVKRVQSTDTSPGTPLFVLFIM